jgi:hypothetical protein
MVDSTQRTILSLTHFPKVITSRKTRGKDPIIDVNVNAIAEHIGSTKRYFFKLTSAYFSPDTATYLQRLEEERKARQHVSSKNKLYDKFLFRAQRKIIDHFSPNIGCISCLS